MRGRSASPAWWRRLLRHKCHYLPSAIRYGNGGTVVIFRCTCARPPHESYLDGVWILKRVKGRVPVLVPAETGTGLSPPAERP
jgi:hypothetical protein